ncbi:acyltransferase [Nostoc sp. TCL26-01]|uniref:acyltransferase family protein n=1 Tax=Nostoc sp. TCL26-01 TaxID=2576904 RepID=UPI0015BC29E6|nr:acyltransferase [Nostoc sp. TCL26-01]QLE56150.1 acyltransferase [Nostoc sp. TCL26-01]
MSHSTLSHQSTVFKTQLSQYLYFIRGVAIAFVVIGHVIGYNIAYGMRQIYNSDLSFLGWICDLINTFHMPTFFIASGIAFTAFSNKNISYKKFFTSKFQKLLIPLIVWCPPYFILQSLSKAKPFSVTDVITAVIFPYEIFWFLHVLIFTTLFAFLYFKNFKSIIGYSLLSVGLFIASTLLNNPEIQKYFFWNLFYIFGVLITGYLPKLETFMAKNGHVFTNIVIPGLCLAMMVICEYFLPKDARIDYLRMINGIVGFILLYFISMQLINRVEKQANNNLLHKFIQCCQYLGAVSIAIYLFHGYFTGFSKAILLKFLGLPHPSLYFVVVSFMGITGPLLMYEILKSRSKPFLFSIGAAK